MQPLASDDSASLPAFAVFGAQNVSNKSAVTTQQFEELKSAVTPEQVLLQLASLLNQHHALGVDGAIIAHKIRAVFRCLLEQNAKLIDKHLVPLPLPDASSTRLPKGAKGHVCVQWLQSSVPDYTMFYVIERSADVLVGRVPMARSHISVISELCSRVDGRAKVGDNAVFCYIILFFVTDGGGSRCSVQSHRRVCAGRRGSCAPGPGF